MGLLAPYAKIAHLSAVLMAFIVYTAYNTHHFYKYSTISSICGNSGYAEYVFLLILSVLVALEFARFYTLPSEHDWYHPKNSNVPKWARIFVAFLAIIAAVTLMGLGFFPSTKPGCGTALKGPEHRAFDVYHEQIRLFCERFHTWGDVLGSSCPCVHMHRHGDSNCSRCVLDIAFQSAFCSDAHKNQSNVEDYFEIWDASCVTSHFDNCSAECANNTSCTRGCVPKLFRAALNCEDIYDLATPPTQGPPSGWTTLWHMVFAAIYFIFALLCILLAQCAPLLLFCWRYLQVRHGNDDSSADSWKSPSLRSFCDWMWGFVSQFLLVFVMLLSFLILLILGAANEFKYHEHNWILNFFMAFFELIFVFCTYLSTLTISSDALCGPCRSTFSGTSRATSGSVVNVNPLVS